MSAEIDKAAAEALFEGYSREDPYEVDDNRLGAAIATLASLARKAEERAEEAWRQTAAARSKLEAVEARVRELETAFKHIHVAEQGEPLSDSCAECGLDL